jgi:putative lysine transport system substrate-binding protein/putative lysine transport system permease protein
MMNQRRFLAAILAAAATLSLLAGCGGNNGGSSAPASGNDGGSTAPAEKKTFTVGMECNYAPFNWTQVESDEFSVPLESAGHAGGYDVMMAKTLADKMGMELVIKKLSWEGLEPAVTSGEIDAIIAGMTATPERKENADFTTPYYESEMVCIVRGDDALANATSLADFTGKNVQGQQNTLYDDIIDQIPSVNHMTPLQSYPLMVVSLQNGEADALTAELPVATGVVTSNPNLAIVRFEDGKGFEADTTVSIAVKKGNTELLNSIQAALDTIDTDTRNQWMTDAVSRQPANG